jgi:hypothetical protein
VGSGHCTPGSPFVVNLQGPPADEDRLSLVFSPAFPCGVEIGATPATLAPLIKLAQWSGCLGDTDCPGQMVVVRSSVQRLIQSLPAEERRRVGHISECEGDTAEPRVKIEITHCGNAAPVWIDSDSSIVVPAGPAVIQIWGPGPDAAGAGAWVADRAVDIELADTAWADVWVKITGCPCTCDDPNGILTTWLNYSEPAWAAIADRVFLRPRRARKMGINSVNSGTGVAVNQSVLFWGQDPSAGLGGTQMGAALFSGNTPPFFYTGAWSHYEMALPAAGATNSTIHRWVIA